ncbi:hypothetical protein K450DRAFT_259413 [Umbelopsis ramanniana AG]|uniref:PH domain-containing protein n=1 Tax=Umbelopsis ramanniana AG TaxID=1314678 RepID=A0AAD5H8U2_UMBRA|nr:uncharacterized protein K450DRAFT_259413 [Umbelopsis ramanniana AG]KAI8575925.1 hypothetical protein K450DRAFT_259413 [Umbelopsis ramanniana AG]
MAFSILLLHTDAHNKNVKRKMTRDTFIMRTRLIEGGENIPAEILDVIYDNIVNCEFQYAQPMDPIQERQLTKAADTRGQTSWLPKLAKPDGPSNQIPVNNDLEAQLERLLPSDNPYDFKGSYFDIDALRRAFSRAPSFTLSGVKTKQSSPLSDGQSNKTSNDSSSIYSKVTSVYKDAGYMVRVAQAGVLDRKYELMQGGKRANVRGWRTFGMILSGSQLIFFADISAFLDWFDIPRSESYLSDRASVSLPATPTIEILNSTAPPSPGQATPPERTSSPMLRSSTSFASFAPSISTTSSSIPSSYLRPVQIISLTDSVCFCDQQYTKYPNAFRLHTGDGQQFIFRAENEQEMYDWMGKLNYAASMKSTGIRMTSSHNGSSRHSRHEDVIRRQELVHAKMADLSVGIDNLSRRIEQDLYFRRNLMVLVPLQKSTREKILQYAETTSSRLQACRLRYTKLECYRTILEKELRSIRESEMIRKMVGVSLQRTPSTDSESHEMRNRMRRSYSASPGYQRQSYDANHPGGPKVPARGSSLIGIPKGFFLEGSEEKLRDDQAYERQSHESDISIGSVNDMEKDNEKIRLVITEPPKLPDAKHDAETLRQRSYSNDEVTKNKSMWDWTSKLRAFGGSQQQEDKPIPVPAVQALKQTKLMRRRSRSHPTMPAGREQDKPLLQTKPETSRQRSNSELSSVGDEEELCVDGPTSWE